MTDNQLEMACEACGSTEEQRESRTFLGFKKLACQNCGSVRTVPLSTGRYNLYFVVAAVCAAALVNYYVEAFRAGGIDLYVIIESWVLLLLTILPVAAILRSRHLDRRIHNRKS